MKVKTIHDENQYTKSTEFPIVVELPKRRQYAFTMRKTNLSKGVCIADYVNHRSFLISRGCEFKQITYEYEKGLHSHGVVLLPEGYDHKYLNKRGWHLYLKEIYDPQGWMKYIKKEEALRIVQERLSAIKNPSERLEAARSLYSLCESTLSEVDQGSPSNHTDVFNSDEAEEAERDAVTAGNI